MPACPKSLTGLKPRTMAESYSEGLIPLQDPKVKVKYHNHVGGLRIGQLLEDLDYIGGIEERLFYFGSSNPLYNYVYLNVIFTYMYMPASI